MQVGIEQQDAAREIDDALNTTLSGSFSLIRGIRMGSCLY
jgi:hypothetical protein